MKASLFVTLFAFLTLSCSDYLDEKGYNTDYSYYSSAEGFDAIVAASYQQTRWIAEWEQSYGLEAFGTDMYMIGADGGNRDFGRYTAGGMNPSHGWASSIWNTNYKGISTINQALKSLETLEGMDEATTNIRKGELLFLRAYYYYMIVVHYGDCPLVLEPAAEPKTDFVRVPQKEVWAQIIEDATTAWNLLPWADADGKVTGNYGRAGKGAAGHLLAKAHMFRYCDKYTKNQSDAKMNEDRGGSDADLDKAIEYASAVCNFGTGSGSGSNHQLEQDFATLWGWDQKTGLTAEYHGPEIVFPIQFSSTYFYNNVDAADANAAGNWLHMLATMYAENYPLVTNINDAGDRNASVSWGTSIGIVRDKITGRAWRRYAPTPWFYKDNGLYGHQNYVTDKPGKLIDSRLYKGHVWVYYSNANPSGVTWKSYSNAAGSFNAGALEGTPRYALGDTALVLSLEDLTTSTRIPFAGGSTRAERLALARAQEPYWYVPLNSISVPKVDMSDIGNRDGLAQAFLTPSKFLDNRRAAVNDQGGFRDFYRYRLAETYILLAEALALKNDYTNSAAALNVVRERAAWKDGEEKYTHFFKYDGGSKADFKKSTVNDMLVTASFLSNLGSDLKIREFFLDENGRETAGEMNRFECLVRNGADFFVSRVVAHNYFAAPNVKPFHRFRPVPQSHLDRLDPKDPNGQNYGY